MQRLLATIMGLALIASVLSGCATTVTTQAMVRATAARDGCWPYGGYQAPTPTVVTPNPTALTLGTPAPTLAPSVVAFPTCLPRPLTPTVTPTPIPRSTPQPNEFVRGLAEVGGTNGKNTNHAMAITPDGDTVVVGWINWRQDPTKTEDGLVWVNARAPSGVWGNAQTLNTSATTINGIVSGLALAAPTNTRIVAAWGDGRSAVYSAESSDGGQTWGAPVALGDFAYQVISLKADRAGGLHLLALTDGFHELRYRYRAAGSSTWTAPTAVGSGPQYQSAFAVLDLPGGGVRRFAAWSTSPGPHMRLARSDDGQTWTSIPVETDRYRAEVAPVAPTLVAAQRPDGSGVVTLAWCQYSKSGVYAQVSTDSGLTWGGEEAVFQNLIDGYAPSLSYDRASDAVVLAVTELLRHHVPPRRIRLAARPLHPNEGWRFRAVSDTLAPDDDGEPEDGDASASLDPTLPTRAPAPTQAPTFTPDPAAPTSDPAAPTPTDVSAASAAQSDQADVPILARWGWRGTIFGNPAGTATWLMAQDERNVQDRLYAQPLSIPALLAKEVS